MKKNLLLIYALGVTVVQAQVVNWAQQGTDTGSGRCYGVGSDGPGNVYAAGSISGPVVFDTITLGSLGGLDAYVAKYDEVGAIQWAISFGGSGNDEALDATADIYGNSFVTGYVGTNATIGTFSNTSAYNMNFFICKINTSGVVQWAKFFTNPGNTSEGKTVAVTSLGQNLAVTGFFRYNADYDSIHITGNFEDVFTARLDPQTGDVFWIRTGGGFSDDEGQGVGIDIQGNVIASGYYKATATFDSVTFPPASGHDIFLIKYDPNGNMLWAKNGMGQGWDDGYRVMIDFNSNIYAEGSYEDGVNFDGTILTSNGARDGYMIKYDASGNMKWIIHGGSAGTGLEYFSEFGFDAFGFLWCTGSFNGAAIIDTFQVTTQGSDIVLCRIDTSGHVLNVILYGGPGDDYGFGMEYVPECFIAVGGTFTGTASFGGLSMTSGGGEDACTILVEATCTIGTGDQHQDQQLLIYPNPSTGDFILENNFSRDETTTIKLYNLLGECVHEQKVIGNTTKIFTPNLAPGFYLLGLYSTKGVVFKHIQKI